MNSSSEVPQTITYCDPVESRLALTLICILMLLAAVLFFFHIGQQGYFWAYGVALVFAYLTYPVVRMEFGKNRIIYRLEITEDHFSSGIVNGKTWTYRWQDVTCFTLETQKHETRVYWINREDLEKTNAIGWTKFNMLPSNFGMTPEDFLNFMEGFRIRFSK